MIINHNMAAVNTLRQMGVNESNSSKSLQKLSSGLRINGASDDAAGLAISEKMRGQIRGLDQATRNSQDGISMIQTAEGSLNETHSILQRMRELATQASSDTNVGVDRGEIQKEVNALTSEVNRIGNTTEFNTQKLLKGGDGSATVTKTGLTSFPAPAFLSGGTADVLSQTTLSDTMAAISNAATGKTMTFHVGGSDFTVNTDVAQNLAASSVSADGKTITLGTLDGTTNLDTANKGATALAALLTTAFGKAGLGGQYTATANGTKIDFSAVANSAADGAAGAIVASTGADLATFVGTAGTVAQGAVVAGARATAADFADFSGANNPTLAAAFVGKGFTIDNKTVEFYDGAAGNYQGNGIGVDIHGAADGAAIVANIVSQAGNKLDHVTLSAGTAGMLTATTKDRGVAGNAVAVADGGVKKEFTATLQIGANQGQSMTLNIADMRAKALNITGTLGSANFTAANTVTDGTNATTTEAALDVSSNTAAGNAITVINNAIQTVSAQRSSLGAFQNRLEHTINNLGTSSENMTAAESRIRDVDMAKEMTAFKKNDILNQAAQAMLAQANQQPQGILQLLR